MRLVGPAGEQIGIVAINDALRLAQESDLDLVEVAPTARPPVCKLMDYGKFKYESALKARESRKNQAQTVIKEIKLRPKIDPHDYGTKRGHVERFLKAGDKVKVTIMFRGREQSRPELGYKLLQRLAGDVDELGFVESAPKQDGRNMIMVIGPHKRKAETKPSEARASRRRSTAPPPPGPSARRHGPPRSARSPRRSPPRSPPSPRRRSLPAGPRRRRGHAGPARFGAPGQLAPVRLRLRGEFPAPGRLRLRGQLAAPGQLGRRGRCPAHARAERRLPADGRAAPVRAASGRPPRPAGTSSPAPGSSGSGSAARADRPASSGSSGTGGSGPASSGPAAPRPAAPRPSAPRPAPPRRRRPRPSPRRGRARSARSPAQRADTGEGAEKPADPAD